MGSADPIQIQGINPLNMGTKMKGLLKGLRYISQIFDEEKDQEIEIGFPTDVKHVAHIGWDGPAVDNPSWMKEFKAPAPGHSAPLDMTGPPKDGPEVKWVSEDSSHRSSRSDESSNRGTRSEEQPREPREGKPSRHRHRSMENALDPDCHGKDASTKSRHSRKHHSKGSTEGSSRGRHSQDPSTADDSSTSKLPDVPKKSRRKKSKDESVSTGVTSRSSRSKANDSTREASDSTTEAKSFVQEEGGRANSGIMT